MEANYTILSYIMDLLNVKVIDLSRAIFVDRTLVSKWKNGARKFNPDFEVLDLMVNYFIKLNNQQGNKSLQRLFKSIYPDYKNNAYSTKEHLIKWLKGNKGNFDAMPISSVDNQLYSSSFEVYMGVDGKRNAFSKFINCIDTLTGRHHIVISETQGCQWISDSNQVQEMVDTFVSILDKGHKLTVLIDSESQLESVVKIMHNLISYLLNDDLQFYNFDHPNRHVPSLYIIKDSMVMVSYCNHGDDYSAIYNDPATVKMQYSQAESRISTGKKMLEILDYKLETIQSLNEVLQRQGYKKDEAYLVTPLPVFTTMPQSTMIDVTKHNNLNELIASSTVYMHKQIQDIFLADISKFFCRQIYDLNYINQVSDQKDILYIELSTLCGQKITVSKQHFKEHLIFLLDVIAEYPLFQVALIDFNEITMSDKFSIWAKQNCFLYSYPYSESKSYVLSEDTGTIYNFYHMCANLWDKLPPINKNRDWVVSQLTKIINAL